MTKDVVTTTPDTALGEAARIFVQRKIGCLPVVGPDGTLLGLVTETDLISAAFLDDEGAEEARRTIDVTPSANLSDWIGEDG